MDQIVKCHEADETPPITNPSPVHLGRVVHLARALGTLGPIPPLPMQPCPELTIPSGLTWAEITQYVLRATLLVNEGSVTYTAWALGVSRRTVYNWLEKMQREDAALLAAETPRPGPGDTELRDSP